MPFRKIRKLRLPRLHRDHLLLLFQNGRRGLLQLLLSGQRQKLLVLLPRQEVCLLLELLFQRKDGRRFLVLLGNECEGLLRLWLSGESGVLLPEEGNLLSVLPGQKVRLLRQLLFRTEEGSRCAEASGNAVFRAVRQRPMLLFLLFRKEVRELLEVLPGQEVRLLRQLLLGQKKRQRRLVLLGQEGDELR